MKGEPSLAVESEGCRGGILRVVDSTNLSEAIGERRRTPEEEEEGIKEDAGGKEKSTRKRRR